MDGVRRGSTEVPQPHPRKFFAPRLGEALLPRERLVERIERFLGEARDETTGTVDVFVVSAPAGFGKTTLLGQWASETTLPVAWYHCDTGDADPVVFLVGLVSALRMARRAPHSTDMVSAPLPSYAPTDGERAPDDEQTDGEATDEDDTDAGWRVLQALRRAPQEALSTADVERMADLLRGDIARNITAPLAVIITGVGLLPEQGPTYAILNRLLTRPPDALRLVFEVREMPPLRFTPLLTQQRLDGLSGDHLRVERDELAALLALRDIASPPDELEQLDQLCDGWITGALLATGALWPSCLSAAFPSTTLDAGAIDRNAVADFLASEVIETLAPPLRAFATDVAVLREMTPALCAELLAISPELAREWLGALEVRTGFVTRSGRRPQDASFTLQPLLRDALLRCFEERPEGEQRRRELHRRAGDALARAGDDDEAVWHLTQAEAFDELARLIEARRGQLLRAGRGETLARWIALLPSALRDARPGLDIALAELHRQAGRLDEAWNAARRACRNTLPHAGADPVLAARSLCVRASIAYIRGHYEESRSDCQRALELAPGDDELQTQAYCFLAAAQTMLVDAQTALDTLAQAEELCRERSNMWWLARLAYMRSHVLLDQGAFVLAAEAAVSALSAAQEANDEVIAISCRLNLGGIRQHIGQFRSARRDLQAALIQSERAGFTAGHIYARANLADLEMSARAYPQAISLYRQALDESRYLADAHLRAHLAGELALALLRTGQGHEGKRLLADELARVPRYADASNADELGARDTNTVADPSDENAFDDIDRVYLTIIAGFVSGSLALNDSTDEHRAVVAAIEQIGQAARIAERHGVRELLARARLYLSALQLALGQEPDARATLSKALRQAHGADETGFTLLEVRHLPELWPLLTQLAQEGEPLAESVLTNALLNEPHADAGETSGNEGDSSFGEHGGAHPVSANAPIRVYAFGDARVLVGDDRVYYWGRAKARELLYYLLEHAGPVRWVDVVNDIWNPEGDEEERAFQTEFRKVRAALKEALGRESAVEQVEHNGRWRLGLDCWSDTHEFERLTAEGVQLAHEGEYTAAARALRRAHLLYTGHFLEDLYSNWVVERRDQLRTRYLTCLDRLGDVEIRLGNYEQAAQIFHELIQAEPTRESAHRGLMRCFAARGDFVEAIKQYRELCAILRDMLDIERPSKKTVELYEAIRARLTTTRARA